MCAKPFTCCESSHCMYPIIVKGLLHVFETRNFLWLQESPQPTISNKKSHSHCHFKQTHHIQNIKCNHSLLWPAIISLQNFKFSSALLAVDLHPPDYYMNPVTVYPLSKLFQFLINFFLKKWYTVTCLRAHVSKTLIIYVPHNDHRSHTAQTIHVVGNFHTT